MRNKVFSIFLIFLLMLCFNTQFVKADILNDTITSGGNFFNMGKESGDSDFALSLNSEIFSDTGLGLMSIVETVGNFVIFVVTVILGIKYIFSGIEGKSIVKETLPTFVIGVIFFYLASNIVGFVSGFGNTIQQTENANTLMEDLWATIEVVVGILSILGLILVGLRYMWTPAEKKADIKGQAIMIALGLILIISAGPLLKFIIGISNSIVGEHDTETTTVVKPSTSNSIMQLE